MADVSTQIFKTTDYGKFVFIKGNRPINTTHVRNLKTRMGKKVLRSPIKVKTINGSGRLGIIDGQHRFVSLKELGEPVEYFFAENEEVTDIVDQNNSGKRWTTSDFAFSHADRKNQHYIEYEGFKERYPEFAHSTILMLLSDTRIRSKKVEDSFKNGTFEVVSKVKAVRMANQLLKIKEFYKGYQRRSFIVAMFRVMDDERFDFDRFIKNLPSKCKTLMDFANWEDYVSAIEEIYNWHRTDKVRFDIFN
jgi:hypothetical protein